MKNVLLAVLMMSVAFANAQVGIGTNTPDASAQLDVASTTRGILVPRMTSVQRTAIVSPTAGLMVFQTDGTPGFYIYKSGQWFSVLDSNNGILKSSGFVNAGVAVTLGTLSARISTSGNRSIQIMSTTAIGLAGSSNNNFLATNPTYEASSTLSGYLWSQPVGPTNWSANTWKYWQSTADFPMHGSSQTINMIDQTNNIGYRITAVIGNGYNNNFISIERL